MTTVKAMKFNWTTLGWEPVEVHEKVLAAARCNNGNRNIRQLVSINEYKRIQQVENRFKVAADPALVSLMDRLPGKLAILDAPEQTCH